MSMLDADGLKGWEEAFIDDSFAPEKRGSWVGKTKKAKGTKWRARAKAFLWEAASPRHHWRKKMG